jgi:hypothetical protein
MEMQDDMKGNPEESLQRALAEFAVETGSGVASERVRQELRREVRVRLYRRWASTALATAAVLAAIVLGVSTRLSPHAVPSQPRTVAREGRIPGRSSAPPLTTATVVAPPPAAARESRAGARLASAGDQSATAAAPLPARPKRGHPSRKPEAPGDWRKGEIVLSPWYYNTALPPSARSVLVRSEVDARTAMRFGVLSSGDTAPVEVLFGEDGLPRAMRFVRHLPTQMN